MLPGAIFLEPTSSHAPSGGTRTVIEHTNINPNKAAHIGHLRNAILGDSLARCIRFLGDPVEVQNYIDDTGVQLADVVVGFIDLRSMDVARVAALPEPFDYYCWDLYTEITGLLEADESLQERRRDVLLALEDLAVGVSTARSVNSSRLSVSITHPSIT